MSELYRKRVDVTVSTNLKKPVALPELPILSVDQLVTGKVLCRTKSKRGFLWKKTTAVTERHVSVTGQGLLLIYTDSQNGFALDVAKAEQLTVDKLNKGQKGYRLNHCTVRISFAMGSADLYLAGDGNHLWIEALERFFDGDGSSDDIMRNLSIISDDISTMTTAATEKMNMSTQTSPKEEQQKKSRASRIESQIEVSTVIIIPQIISPVKPSNATEKKVPEGKSPQSLRLTTVFSAPVIVGKETTVSQKPAFQSANGVVRNSKTTAPWTAAKSPVTTRKSAKPRLSFKSDFYSNLAASIDSRELPSPAKSSGDEFASVFRGLSITRMSDQEIISAKADDFENRSSWPFKDDQMRDPLGHLIADAEPKTSDASIKDLVDRFNFSLDDAKMEKVEQDRRMSIRQSHYTVQQMKAFIEARNKALEEADQGASDVSSRKSSDRKEEKESETHSETAKFPTTSKEKENWRKTIASSDPLGDSSRA